MPKAFPFWEINQVFLTPCQGYECDMTREEARILAGELLKAADELDRMDKELDEYFKANPPSRVEEIDIPF